MAEAFVRTIKRDYVHVSPCPDAQPSCTSFNHYNEVHPHKALGYHSPREFIAAHAKLVVVSGGSGYNSFRDVMALGPCRFVHGWRHFLN